MRAWPNAWDVFRRRPSRGSRGRRASAVIFRDLFLVVEFRVLFVFVFVTSMAHGLLQIHMRPPCLVYLYTSLRINRFE